MRRLPDPPPTYCFTRSVYDDSMAPASHHAVHLACPNAPYEVDGGGDSQAEPFADAMVERASSTRPDLATASWPGPSARRR